MQRCLILGEPGASLDGKMVAKGADLGSIIRANTELGKIQDSDILLERILLMARQQVNAEAGSIYVKQTVAERDGDAERLFIKHAQNDALQKTLAPGEKQVYSKFSLLIDEKSVSGYCAYANEIVNLPDMYSIPADRPYSFNSTFDVMTGYRTVSSLTFPLAVDDRILGVIQVMNKLDGGGRAVPFSQEDELVLTNFALSATSAMQRTYITRAMIMRLIKMAELRDPEETGNHVNRVSGYAVEIYDRWAHDNKVPATERETFRDILKIGAMLHDVGKVAISDAILKKPGRFTPEEYEEMKHHAVYGASLFNDSVSAMDRIAMEIALTHHESWDGTGYPGWVNPFNGEVIRKDADGNPLGKKGMEIPLAGRIVAIADVYDALSSKRVYKEPWTEEQVLEEMRRLSGTRFDPELVDIFFEVLPIIRQTREQYS